MENVNRENQHMFAIKCLGKKNLYMFAIICIMLKQNRNSILYLKEDLLV